MESSYRSSQGPAQGESGYYGNTSASTASVIPSIASSGQVSMGNSQASLIPQLIKTDVGDRQ